jgi:hypothetical protein
LFNEAITVSSIVGLTVESWRRRQNRKRRERRHRGDDRRIAHPERVNTIETRAGLATKNQGGAKANNQDMNAFGHYIPPI